MTGGRELLLERGEAGQHCRLGALRPHSSSPATPRQSPPPALSPAPRANLCEGAVRFQFSLEYVIFYNEVAGM